MSSSKRWLDRQKKDPYVNAAAKQGYCSRAAFKLLEINTRFKFLKPGLTVLDLGAAPGSWSQVVSECVGPSGQVISIDLLPITGLVKINNIVKIQADLRDPSASELVAAALGEKHIQVVLSDISPNLTGNAVRDQAAMLELGEIALEYAQKYLEVGRGIFLIKVFQGTCFKEYVNLIKENFEQVQVLKPKASRADSRECYVFGSRFKLQKLQIIN